jgi:hypothetical protein
MPAIIDQRKFAMRCDFHKPCPSAILCQHPEPGIVVLLKDKDKVIAMLLNCAQRQQSLLLSARKNASWPTKRF